jgi:hypothetical protein
MPTWVKPALSPLCQPNKCKRVAALHRAYDGYFAFSAHRLGGTISSSRASLGRHGCSCPQCGHCAVLIVSGNRLKVASSVLKPRPVVGQRNINSPTGDLPHLGVRSPSNWFARASSQGGWAAALVLGQRPPPGVGDRHPVDGEARAHSPPLGDRGPVAHQIMQRPDSEALGVLPLNPCGTASATRPSPAPGSYVVPRGGFCRRDWFLQPENAGLEIDRVAVPG